MKNYHNEKMETAARAEIEELQAKRLRAVVDHVYRSNPIYRKLFDARGRQAGGYQRPGRT